jgi:hypothetical protein
MNFRTAFSGGLFALLFLIVLFANCDGRRDEARKAAEKARKQAEQELQKAEETERRAKRVIQRKFEALSKSDSRFKDYAPYEKRSQSVDREGDEGGLIGSVALRGEKPGAVESLEGMTITLWSDDDFYYSTTVNSENHYRFFAPPGTYTLVIDEPGYRYFEKRVVVIRGSERLVGLIRLRNK